MCFSIRSLTLCGSISAADKHEQAGSRKQFAFLRSRLATEGLQISAVESIVEPIPISEIDCQAYIDDSLDDLSILDMGHDRVGIHTQDGSLGAAPPDVQMGDEVVIFLGSRNAIHPQKSRSFGRILSHWRLLREGDNAW